MDIVVCLVVLVDHVCGPILQFVVVLVDRVCGPILQFVVVLVDRVCGPILQFVVVLVDLPVVLVDLALIHLLQVYWYQMSTELAVY